MEMFTLNEASAKLKEHKINADTRKLIREAKAGKIILSFAVYGYFYSPTIKAKCRRVVSKYLNELLNIENENNSYNDKVKIKFETEFIRDVLNGRKYSELTDSEKISFLIDNDLLNSMYERYSNPSLGGYFFIPPKQLINSNDGVFKIEGFADLTDTYFANLEININDILIAEYHLNQYIQSLSGKPKNNPVEHRLYTEISANIPNWLDVSQSSVIKKLEEVAGKDGSCIIEVDYKNKCIKWFDWSNNKQSTDFKSIGTKIRRLKKATLAT